jgi:hypothetical protein
MLFRLSACRWVALCIAMAAAAEPAPNKFGIGVYGGSYIGVDVSAELPWARELVGERGSVLLVASMSFSQNGNVSSCAGGCVPAAVDAAAVRQAYALGLRPVVRLAQWPRTIRDFADDAPATRRQFSALAQAYKKFAAALPLPPDGSPLDVVVLNEPNVCGEWQCKGGGGALHLSEQAAEVATCLRDILAALRPLPRLRLSAAPTAYTAPLTCSCDGSANPAPDWDTPTDLAFMAGMLKAAPDLYSNADFFNSHPYPFGGRPFADPLGRAGAVHYRAQLNASGRPELPVLLTEAGWKGPNETEKSASVVAAFKEEWLPDERVASVLPFLLSANNGTPFSTDGWPWVKVIGGEAQFTLQFNSTRELRCGLNIGGPCGPNTSAALE